MCVCNCSKDQQNLIGKIVFVERNKPGDSYYNGEYIVAKQTPNNLYGVSPKPGYGGHELKTFPLIGEGAFSIISQHEDKKFVRETATELLRFSYPVGKERWIETVYSGARENARLLFRAIGESAPETIPVVSTISDEQIERVVKTVLAKAQFRVTA